MGSVRLWLLALCVLSLSCASAPEPQPPPEPSPPPAPAVPEPPPPPPPPDPRDFTAEVRFEPGSAELSAAGIRELEDFAAKLRPFPQRSVEVVGSSGSSGAETKDPWLAEQRAKSVASFLVSEGIAPDHIALRGLGEEAADAAAEGNPRGVRVTVR